MDQVGKGRMESLEEVFEEISKFGEELLLLDSKLEEHCQLICYGRTFPNSYSILSDELPSQAEGLEKYLKELVNPISKKDKSSIMVNYVRGKKVARMPGDQLSEDENHITMNLWLTSDFDEVKETLGFYFGEVASLEKGKWYSG